MPLYITNSSADEGKHYPLVERQGLALFHLYALLVEALHRVHFASVGFTTAVYLAKTTSTDYPMYAEVVHC